MKNRHRSGGVKASEELLASLREPREQARVIVATVWADARRRPDDTRLAALRKGIGYALQHHKWRKVRFRMRVMYGRGGSRLSPRVAPSKRLRSLVDDLAIEYERALGASPGRSDAGPFARLVQEACRALGEDPPRSVRHMLRHRRM
jgi:hypothetical protein